MSCFFKRGPGVEILRAVATEPVAETESRRRSCSTKTALQGRGFNGAGCTQGDRSLLGIMSTS